MIKRIVSFFTSFINSESMPLRDKFLHVILLVLSIFLFTQCFSAFLYIGEENVYATLFACFIMSGLYFYLYKTGNYNVTRFVFFIFSATILAILWFESEGVLGSIPYFIVFSVFMFVAISEPKYHKYIISVFMLFYAALVCLEYLYPQYITPYGSVDGQKIDITVSVFFVAIFISLSFNFIIRKYEEQQLLAEKEAQKQKFLNDELDSFVYKASHDLRAPVLSAIGLTDLMTSAKTLEDAKKYATLQKESLEKLDNFITDIIQYSQNNRVPIEQSPIDFEEIFQESLAACYKKTYARPVNCEISVATENILFSDKMRLQTLFDNLLINAHQFLDVNKTTHFFHIEVKNTQKDWEITFTDNGIGIEKEHVPRIFEMFYRASNKAKGSGIGLYIVGQAMAKLGGTISCTSQMGVGTTFVVKLPNQFSEKQRTPLLQEVENEVIKG